MVCVYFSIFWIEHRKKDTRHLTERVVGSENVGSHSLASIDPDWKGEAMAMW